MDPLFPEIPEKLEELSDEDLQNLLLEHETAAKLIEDEDEDFLKGATADEVLEALEVGATQVETIRALQSARLEAQETYAEEKTAKLSRVLKVEETVEEEPEVEVEAEEVLEVVAEAEAITEEAVAEVVEEKELVLASVVEEPVEVKAPLKMPVRRPPTPSVERQLKESQGTALVAASGLQEVRGGQVFDPESLAIAMSKEGRRWGAPSKHERGSEERRLIARADFDFPEELRLSGNFLEDAKKIKAVIPETVSWGDYGKGNPQALVASGGLCAPLTPIYSMPNFASLAEPVWDALPKFQADRGGVNVPAATYIGDITTAISSISEANDALGGTYATKSCQDLDCVEYTEVPVQILAHCREYGNLNAMAWPEKIQHENELTMAALARTSESFMLDRIKALSINVTQAAVGSQYGSFASLVHAIVKAGAGIRYRLRMNRGAQLQVLLPAWILDHLAADTAATQFDRFQAQNAMGAHLGAYNISVAYFLDDVVAGTAQGFAAETAGALDEFPDDVQYAIHAVGQFIGVDSGSLELGLVRDSTLNSTNDFQIFGERFRNLAMLGPAQGALWVTQDICPNGVFPALGTALSC